MPPDSENVDFDTVGAAHDARRGTTETQGPHDGANGKDKDDKQNAPANFPLLTIADLEAMPDPVWLIDERLVADSLCVLYGPWGSFKSFIVLHLALCLATGTPFFGHKVVRSDVVYIAGEGAGGIKKRVEAWMKHHGFDDVPGFRVVPVAVNLLDRAEAQRLIATVLEAQKADGFDPRLAIVDTLHRSMPGGDENAAKEMGIVIACYQRRGFASELPG